MMKSLKAQTDAKIEMGRKANPDFMNGVDEVIERAKALQQGSEALKVGEQAPAFVLPDPNGGLVSMLDLLEQGPLIITFYRGGWCPYCNLQLNALQSRLDDFHALGAKLVAISPQVPDDSLSENEIKGLAFDVLSDQDAKVAAAYGVAWEVPAFLSDHMRVDRELDLDVINNGNGKILPIPATYIIGKDGIVSWRFVDVDYRARAEPDHMIAALKKLSE